MTRIIKLYNTNIYLKLVRENSFLRVRTIINVPLSISPNAVRPHCIGGEVNKSDAEEDIAYALAGGRGGGGEKGEGPGGGVHGGGEGEG